MRSRPLIDPRDAAKLLDYDPITGIFTWRVKRRGRPYGHMPAGTRAGSIWRDGYRHICINGTTYSASRLAFLLMMGRWPDCQMDHKNRDRSDDRWFNLREATPHENIGNSVNRSNRLGLKGVCFEADRNKYKAYIEMEGRTVNLGRYGTAEEAQAAYEAVAKIYFGEFARIK